MRQVPVAEGSLAPLSGIEKAQIADFVHGTDGFGNTGQLPAKVQIGVRCFKAGHAQGM